MFCELFCSPKSHKCDISLIQFIQILSFASQKYFCSVSKNGKIILYQNTTFILNIQHETRSNNRNISWYNIAVIHAKLSYFVKLRLINNIIITVTKCQLFALINYSFRL